MALVVVRNDITKIEVDAIVNSANHEPIVGRGSDGAIYLAAGIDELLAVRKKIGRINFGEARITPAFNLPAKFIIHTVAPIWQGGTFGEVGLLRACYRNSLDLALKNNCTSIAFTLMATGINNFPHDEAIKIAVTEIQNFLFAHEMKVVLAVFGSKPLSLMEKIFSNIDAAIDDRYVASAEMREYSGGLKYWREFQQSKAPIKLRGKNFSEHLLELIGKRGLEHPEVYKAANISSKVFSDVITKSTPKKQTAIALALALKLSLEETQELLATAGHALSEGIVFDSAIISCIRRGLYNVNDEVNVELAQKNLTPLGTKSRPDKTDANEKIFRPSEIDYDVKISDGKNVDCAERPVKFNSP